MDICKQAELISTELGKAAIKLKEFWHDGIEEAWKIYESTKNIGEVVKMMKGLHESEREREVKSNSEISFEQEFGLELREAYQWLLRFERTSDIVCFSQAF
jgi:FKBP12-rapamycin complex-associated protein